MADSKKLQKISTGKDTLRKLVRKPITILALLLLLVCLLPGAKPGADAAGLRRPLRWQTLEPGEQTLSWQFAPGARLPEAPVLALESPQGGAPQPSAWTRVASQWWDGEDWEVVFHSDGGANPTYKNLTNNETSDQYPSLGPMANSIAYMANRDENWEIYTVNPDGSNRNRLTRNSVFDGYPSWSPDGRLIVFESERDGNREIYRMQQDGTDQVRVTNSASSEFGAVFSVDGKKLAWIQPVSSTHGQIYTSGLGGENPVALGPPLCFLSKLAFSRDGSMIALEYDHDCDGWLDIGLMDADGSNLRLYVADNATQWDEWWLGGWSQDDSLYLTKADFIYYSNEYYLQSTVLYIYHVKASGSEMINSSYLKAFPSPVGLDLQNPHSQPEKFAAFTPPDGLNLRWGAYDYGASGVAQVKIYQSSSENGPWQLLYTHPYPEVRLQWVQGTAGTQTCYRFVAEDFAGIQQQDFGTVDVLCTTWTKAKLYGEVLDNRGRPIPQAALNFSWASINPPFSDASGAYQAFFTAQGANAAHPTHAGYADWAGSSIQLTNLTRFNTYLPPPESWLTNGDFEQSGNAFAGWSLSGSLPVTTTTGLNGTAALRLGQTCPYPCLSAPESFTNQGYTDTRKFASVLDQQKRLHVLLRGNLYMVRETNGSWSAPEAVGGFTPAQLVWDGALAVDLTGTVHVVIPTTTDGYYFYKTAGGAWSAGEPLGHLSSPVLLAGPDNTIHFLYNPNSGNKYRRKTAGGSWTAPLEVGGYFGDNNMLWLADGSILMVFNDSYTYFNTSYDAPAYRILAPDGSLGAKGYFPNTSGNNPMGSLHYLRVSTSPDGRAHMVSWKDSSYYVHDYLPGYGWTRPSGLGGMGSSSVLIASDPQNGLHLFGLSTGISHYYRAPDQAGFTYTGKFNGPAGDFLNVVSDPSGAMYLTYSSPNGHYFTTHPVAGSAGQASVKQQVSIPAQAQNPTLAFLYQVVGYPSWQDSQVEATVQSQGMTEPQVVFSSAHQPYWGMGWADLSAWKGQQVEIGIRMQQAAGEKLVHLYLDGVSLGEWQTPWVQSIQPAHAVAGESLYLEGLNLSLESQVFVDGAQISELFSPSPDALTFQLPPDLAPGWHQLRVVNPGGQETLLPQAFQVGWQTYLPFTGREY